MKQVKTFIRATIDDNNDEADNFMDAAYDMPDWWTTPAMNIMEVTNDEQ